jgi:hypothetical protein
MGAKFLEIYIFCRSVLKPAPPINLTRLSDALDFSRKDLRAGCFEKSIELIFVSSKVLDGH